MGYMKQAGIILVISFVGEVIKQMVKIPIPASIYGFVILFILLQTKVMGDDSVKDAGSFFIEIMPLMFIPGAVGIIEAWKQIEYRWHIYSVIIIVSTVVVIIFSGRVTEFILKMENRDESTDH